jgi:hypothetical protein
MTSLYLDPTAPEIKKFNLRGWKKFAEESGVNKKEAMETFEWCEYYDKKYLSDCRDGLEKVDGAKEWLKSYSCPKGEYPFSTGLGAKIVLCGDHSGASFNSVLFRYKYLLNDWDTFVYEQKKRVALKDYRDSIPPIYVYRRLLANCDSYLKNITTQMYDLIMSDWSMYSPEGDAAKTVDGIRRAMIPLVEELEELYREDMAREAEMVHRDLIGSLEFLYENPSRWFDTSNGCSLSPGDPQRITSRALNEMEEKYPGYKNHIEMVKKAIPRMNDYPWEYRDDSVFMEKFMSDEGVIGGVRN